jgi:hypothetical protein
LRNGCFFGCSLTGGFSSVGKPGGGAFLFLRFFFNQTTSLKLKRTFHANMSRCNKYFIFILSFVIAFLESL